jgi:hypothetical protein
MHVVTSPRRALAGLFLWSGAVKPTARRPVDWAGLLVTFAE